MWQAEHIRALLLRARPDMSISLKQIRTSGDKILDVPLATIGGKGLFVKEIEEALLAQDIDLAVHSMKDVPASLPKGLAILGIPEREDPRDVLISRTHIPFDRLPQGASIGTSSLRRQAQLLQTRPDLRITMLRGNLDTRLRKLESGEYDAIVVAAAGLKRLGWLDHVTEYLSSDRSLPAIGQGVLGIEGREDDEYVKDLLGPLDHQPTRVAVLAERSFLRRLEGGCQVPIAGHAILEGTTLRLEGLVASLDGKRVIRDSIHGPMDETERLGTQLGDRILNAGGDKILREIYGTT